MKNRKETSTDFENEQLLRHSCPFIFALTMMGKRWKPAILWKLTQGVNRFGILKREIPPISEKMLTQHLRELEQDGLISRVVFPEIPPRVEYELTNLGRSLEPILRHLMGSGKYANVEHKHN